MEVGTGDDGVAKVGTRYEIRQMKSVPLCIVFGSRLYGALGNVLSLKERITGCGLID